MNERKNDLNEWVAWLVGWLYNFLIAEYIYIYT